MSEHEQVHASETEVPAHETAPATIGRVLRQARESRGESLSDAAYALKLMPRQVEAMEAGRFDLLPGPAFVRGFLRNYARYLGINIEDMLASLGGPASGQVNLAPVTNAQGAMPVAGSELRLFKPVVVVVCAMLVMLAAGWYFDWFRIADMEATAPVASSVDAPVDTTSMLAPPGAAPTLPGAVEWQPEPLVLEPATEPPAVAFAQDGEVPEAEAVGGVEPEAPVEAPAPPEEPAAQSPDSGEGVSTAPEGASRLVFRVEGESWIQVRDASGATIFTGTEQPGSLRTVDGQAPLSIVVGNAGRVNLEYDGEAVDLAPHTRSSGVARLELQ